MTHEFDGEEYEKASAHQQEWGAKLIAALDLQGTERVLDLGCGDGTLTARIADLLPDGNVVGIDASRGMIDTARPKERENLHFFLKDINELDFGEPFDVAFSNATLHWVKGHRRLLRNVRRSLCVSGRIRFNFAADGNCAHFFKTIREAMSLDGFSAHFSDFQWPWYMPTVDEYTLFVESYGLLDVQVRGENADRFFPDVETMRWSDGSTNPVLSPFWPVSRMTTNTPSGRLSSGG